VDRLIPLWSLISSSEELAVRMTSLRKSSFLSLDPFHVDPLLFPSSGVLSLEYLKYEKMLSSHLGWREPAISQFFVMIAHSSPVEAQKASSILLTLAGFGL